MCLYVSKRKSSIKFVNGKAKLWKVVRETDNQLTGLWQTHYVYSPGYNFPSDYNLLEVTDNVVHGGAIHVCTTLKEAKSKVSINPYGRKIIPVYVWKKDLLAIGGDDDAVFKKIFIYKKDYDDLVKLFHKDDETIIVRPKTKRVK